MIANFTKTYGWKSGRAGWNSTMLMLGLLLAIAITGCKSEDTFFNAPVEQPALSTNAAAALPEKGLLRTMNTSAKPAGEDTNSAATLREGNVLKISFPGSPSLNTVTTIGQDGKITLPLVGDIKAAGKTPAALDKMLTDLYAPQLTTKEVIVEVQSAAFPIYVTGAVLRPGKITLDHSITALEAVMEAGGYNYNTANMKKVVLIRKEGDGTKKYILNLEAIMEGQSGEPFYLKPEDILFVPEKFNWF